MKIEYEATFVNINKDLIREKLSKIGARLKKAEVKMRRTSFFPPEKFDKNSAYLRVRDEGSDYITMALKVQEKGSGIETERESEIEIKSYEKGVQFFKDLGYEQKSEQESLRETWEKDGVEVMIDTWPFLETYIEIESNSESRVKALAVELGFKWSEARFGASLAPIVKEKYGLSENEINNNTPKIVFGEKNPFDKKNRE